MVQCFEFELQVTAAVSIIPVILQFAGRVAVPKAWSPATGKASINTTPQVQPPECQNSRIVPCCLFFH
jgi:hypothetical protein